MTNKKDHMKKGTKTSSFGSNKRESHDSSQFYNTALYKDLHKPQKVEYIDNSKLIPPNVLDHLILGDSQKIDLIILRFQNFNTL